jgi:hypothetical protein
VHVAYVTGGTVGVGDLMHGVALRRAARRAGGSMRVSLLSPKLPFPALQGLDDHVVVDMQARTLLDRAQAEQTPLMAALRALQPDVIVVGHFWANVHFVLPALGVPAVLLLRKAPPVWVQGPAVAPFSSTRAHYERIFEIEPVGFPSDSGAPRPNSIDYSNPWRSAKGLNVLMNSGAERPNFEALPPIVVANRDELLTASVARRILAPHDDGRPLRLVFQAGLAGEAQSMAATAACQTVVSDLHDTGAPWPIAPLLDGADEIVTGAGYNAFWEVQHLGLAHKTRFTPFARSIDDQAWRLSLPVTNTGENGADVLVRCLERG